MGGSWPGLCGDVQVFRSTSRAVPGRPGGRFLQVGRYGATLGRCWGSRLVDMAAAVNSWPCWAKSRGKGGVNRWGESPPTDAM